jgi:hypothetical protein
MGSLGSGLEAGNVKRNGTVSFYLEDRGVGGIPEFRPTIFVLIQIIGDYPAFLFSMELFFKFLILILRL